MSDSYFSGDGPDAVMPGDLPDPTDKPQRGMNTLGISTTAFANAITKAFTQAVTGGKQFDDVLKSLALRMSALTVAAAFKPVAKGLLGGLNSILTSNSNDSSGTSNASSAITPFASGGVIGAPTYFPLSSGGLGLAGEAGPEAIMPLTRGSDGTLGVAMAGAGAPANISVQIVAPDPDSFRRSEAYITGQIARAVARGQRSM